VKGNHNDLDGAEPAIQPEQPAQTPTARTGIAAGVVFVSASAYISMALSLVRGVLVANAIGKVGQGILRLVGILAMYGTNSHVGLLHGMNKRMPFLLGRGDERGARHASDVGFTAIMSLAAVGGAGLLGYLLIWGHYYGTDTRFGLIIAGTLILLTQLTTIYQSLMRSYGAFHLLGLTGIVYAVLDLVLMVTLAKLLATPGALMGLAGRTALSVILMALVTRYRFTLRVDWQELLVLFRVGFPLFLLVFADQFLRTADSLAVVKILRSEALGLYAVGGMVAMLIYNVPNAAAYVMFPHLMEKMGRENDVQAMRRDVLIPTAAFSYVMPFVGGLMCIATPAAVATVLKPEYLGALPAAQIQVMGAALLSLPVISENFLVAVERQTWLAVVKVACAIGVGLLSLGALALDLNIAGAAAGAAAAYLIFTVIILTWSFRWFYRDARELARAVAGTLAPYAYCLGAIWIALRLTGAVVAAGSTSIPWATIGCGTFTLIYLPLLVYADRRVALSARIRGWLAKRRNP